MSDREVLAKLETSDQHHPYVLSHAAAEQRYRQKLKVRANEQALGLSCVISTPAKPTPPFASQAHAPKIVKASTSLPDVVHPQPGKSPEG